MTGCDKCKNAPRCVYIHPYTERYCPPLEDMVGYNKSSREGLAADVIGEGYEGYVDRDYKRTMVESWEAGERVREMSVDDIRCMPSGSDKQVKMKAVIALLWFGVPRSRIPRLLGLGKTFFYQLLRDAKKKYAGGQD